MNKKRIRFIGIYFIIFAVGFLSFLLLEAINAELHLDLMEKYINIPSSIIDETYDLSNIKFKRVYLTEKYRLKDKCKDGCNLSVSRNKRTIYYMIDKKVDGYYYKMAINSKLLVENKFFGQTIENAYIDFYINNIILFNTIRTDSLTYDYLNIINRDYYQEEIESIGENSLELMDDGIIYNTAECHTASSDYDRLIRNKRVAFSSEKEVISEENAVFGWCA